MATDGDESLVTEPPTSTTAPANVSPRESCARMDRSALDLHPPPVRRWTIIEPRRGVPLTQPPVDQTGFEAAPPFAAPDGRVVAPGAVVLAQPAGEDATEQRNAAVAVFSPQLKLDPSFGAPCCGRAWS